MNPRIYLNSIIADMPYRAKASESELLEMLPHKWILKHPEAIITKEEHIERFNIITTAATTIM